MVVCDVEVIRKERVFKTEQMQNREDAKQGLVGGPVPYTCCLPISISCYSRSCFRR